MNNNKIYKPSTTNNLNMIPGDLEIGRRMSPFSDETLVFLDEGFIYKLNKYFGQGKYLKYNLIDFSKNLAKKQSLICEHIYYYTAPPFQSDKTSKQESERYRRYENFKNNISSDEIISIREGRCQRLKIDEKFVYGQKGVDALAIIDLMSIPLEHKEVKKVILIANDSDFVPVVEKLKKLNIEVILYTHYSKKRESSFSRSNELLKSVSKYAQLSKQDFLNSPLIKDIKEVK